ncbi:MAG: DUF63 family protein [Thermoplasmatota archaeon]
MDLFNVIQKNGYILTIGLILTILLSIGIGYLLAPNLIYDQWIWKYYWGPIVSDAVGHQVTHNGVSAQEGYTLISEITYGVILVIAIFFIYKILKKLGILVDWRFCLALLPFIIFGPVTRVLEDTYFFDFPVVYWFISPLIYIQIAFYALFFVFLGYLFNRWVNPLKHPLRFLYPLVIFFVLNIFGTMIWVFGSKHSLYSFDPWLLYGVSVLAVIPFLYQYYKTKIISINTTIFTGGLLFLLSSLYLIARWLLGEQWGYSQGVRFDVFALVIGLVGLIVFGVFFATVFFKNNEKIRVYQNPLNLAMITGHLIDGIATYVSIYDPLQMNLPLYMEKHPASHAVLEIWPPLFPILKFFLIIFVIYLFDIFYKNELGKHPMFTNLMKIAILILGFSPGVRNLLRVTMGV